MSLKNSTESASVHTPRYYGVMDVVLFALTFVLIVFSNLLVFVKVDNERTMGPVQRILYFHVGSATACYCAAAILLIASLTYLATRDRRADVVIEAAGEVALVFASIVLATGMIWGHSSWNTWWSWEPRLVSFLVMWLIFFGLVLLRVFGDPAKLSLHCAVLGIVGAITVPIVVFSIKLLPKLGQLHPEVVEHGGLKSIPLGLETFSLAVTAVVLLQFLLVWLRTRVGFIQRSLS